MISLRARIVRKVIKRFLNVNPKVCKDPIKKMKLLVKTSAYKPPKGFIHQKIDIGGMPSEILKKKDITSDKVVYILHGGAYVAGMSDLYRNLAKKYCIAAGGANVLMIDYRVAPEYVFPAALDDALKGWDWLLEQGYKEENIIVIGDSAGGNLTLALMQRLKQFKRKLPKAIVCISPWTDMTASGKSYYENYNMDVMFGNKEIVSEELVNEMLGSEIFSYCGDNDRKDPLLSPVFGDYKKFPPTLITVGGDEMLLSDSITVADKIKDAGGEVTLHIAEGMFHVFPMINVMPEAKLAMNLILEFISKYTG